MYRRRSVSTKSILDREEVITVCGQKFRVFVYLEKRYDCRAAIGAKGIHIRIATYLNVARREQEYLTLISWARKYIIENKLYIKTPQFRQYNNNDIFSIAGHDFKIKIEYRDAKTSTAHLKDGVIYMQLSYGMKPIGEMRHKSYLVARLIGNAFTPIIEQRLHRLNAEHFGKKIKRVTLRNNATNWGSCSYDGHISISSRLLFAPQSVIDYILIHELAHLVEHNHSDKFWRLVESAMPDYRKAEQWLEKNGNQCMF